MFAGKTALITGAASGIGLATARLLGAQDVAHLVLCDIDAAALHDVGRAIPNVTALYPGDVADEAYWRGLEPRLSGLDLAVINAGVSGGGMIAELDFSDWRRVLSVNLDGAFLSLRATMRALER